MGEDRINKKIRDIKPELWALFVIILSAAALRLIFITGMVRGDSLNYAHTAFEYFKGTSDLGDWAGVSRIGLFGPVALLYTLFGPSEISTLAFPFLTSLISIVFVYLIAKMFSDYRGGLIAALIWAFLPLDVFLSSSLLPDVPVAALSTGSMYFIFKGIRRKTLLNANIALAAGLIIWSIFVKPIAIISLLGGLGVIIQSRWEQAKIAALELSKKLPRKLVSALKWALLAFLFVGIFLYARIQIFSLLTTMSKTSSDLISFLFTGTTELDISGTRLDFSGLFVFLAPLFLLSFVWALIKGGQKLKQLLLWASIVFLYYEWGTINLDPLIYVPLQEFNEARNFLFILAPIIVICGIYIAQLFEKEGAPRIFSGISILGLIGAWNLKGINIEFEAPSWLMAISVLLVVFSILSINIVQNNSTRLKAVFGVLLLLSISFASLRPAIPYHSSWYADRVERMVMLRQTLDILHIEKDLPILINSFGNAMILNYVSNFELGFDWVGLGQGTDNKRIQNEIKDSETSYLQILFSSPGEAAGKGQEIVKIKGSLGNQVVVVLIKR